MYTLITDVKEKEELIDQYFALLGSYIEDAMDSFSKKVGFRFDAMAILFKESLDEHDDKEELAEIEEGQVLLVAEEPAADIDSKVYLSFKELCNHLKRIIDENYKQNEVMQELLRKIKQELDAW